MAIPATAVKTACKLETECRVSVIVPIYNGVTDLPDLEACLLAQSFPPEQVEYLLVDNHSHDDTPQRLKAFAMAAKQRGMQVRPLTEAKIQSSYAARNTGIQAARGKLLVFTDADCRPEPDWLVQIVQPFVDPNVGIVVGEIQALPGNTWLEQYAELAETLSQKHTLAHSFHPYGQTANLAVRRQLLETSGLFRPHLTTGGDADLCWRLQQHHSFKVQFAAAAIVRHRHRRTLAELRSQWRRYGKSNKYLHALHGVPLMRALPPREVRYRLVRWLLKDVPIAAGRIVSGKAPIITLLETPLVLYCQTARYAGQQQAQLPPEAQDIEWLGQPVASEHSDQSSANIPGS